MLIHGGTLVDGTGSPGVPAALAIRGGRLTILHGDVAEVAAGRRIDATGLVVAPGFIDLHSHSGLMILADPRHEPKVRQGVTTEVIGVDGNAYAPFRRAEDLLAFVELNAGLDGHPPISYDWSSVASYLARFDRRVSVNLYHLVGNSALRIDALGWDDIPADRPALDRMRAVLREGMEDGAFGVSSGLDYPPGAFASTDELAELTAEAAKLSGIYHTHVRYALGDRFLDPFREAIEIGRRGGSPVHITHFYHRVTFPGSPEQMIGLVEDARAEGLDVTWDTYPYEWASTRLLIMLPPWVQAGGPAALKERLADRAVRKRLRTEIAVRGRSYAGQNPWDDTRLGYFATAGNAAWEGRTPGGVHGGDGPRRGGRDLRAAAGGGPARQPGDAGALDGRTAAVPAPSGGHGGHGLHVCRRPAEPAHVRVVPADPGRVRARYAPDAAGGGGAQDDLGAGSAAEDRGSRSPCRRVGGGRGGVRPGDGSRDGHVRGAAAVPGGDSLCHRQRRAGRRPWCAHGRNAGPRPATRSSRGLTKAGRGGRPRRVRTERGLRGRR